MSFDIACPDLAGQPFNVVPTGSGSPPTGIICAHGDASNQQGNRKEVALEVKALVVQNFNPSNPPSTPLSGAVTATIDSTNSTWKSTQVPGAVFGTGSPLPLNTLLVWFRIAQSGPNNWVLVNRGFRGLQATAISCCEGSAQFRAAQQQAGYTPGVALAMAPLLWQLVANGFEAGKAIFNGTWVLDLREVIGGYCVWDNGGDGAKVPHVELRCESPLVTTWQLTLRNGTGTSVCYTRRATEWNPLAANVLHRSDNGEAVSAAPDELVVTPG